VSNDVVIVIVVATALLFDFTNGFHDTANVVATSISTHAMPPRVAVAYAAVFNFVGAFISLAVAATVAKDVVDAGVITPPSSSPDWSGRSPGTWRPGTSAFPRARRTP
jgi:PiT family inorganic phosphate transporter